MTGGVLSKMGLGSLEPSDEVLMPLPAKKEVVLAIIRG